MEKVRLDKYLAKVLGVPRAQIAHLIDKKMVLVNGVVAKKSEIVGEGDKVEIAESSAGNSVLGMQFRTCENFGESTDFSLVLSPKFSQIQKPHRNHFDCDSLCKSTANHAKIAESTLDSAPSTQEANSAIADEFLGFCEASDKDKTKVYRGSEPMQSLKSRCESKFAQIQRIYEDDDILVLNKPPFLATHGAPSLKEPSLVEWLKARKIQRSTISGELREGIVHRLDKQTSGALVVAKNNDAHNALSAQLADKTMGRLYLAIIDLPLKEDIEIECYLARNPKNRLKISKVDMRKYKKFAESNLNPCEAPENSPASWCKKSDSKGAVVPPADFLLEAELRGSPPKSEKRQLLGTHLKRVGGSGAGGAALLRKEKNSNENAESIRDLQSGLPRAINCARNDNSFRDSSPKAQNNKVKNSQNLPKFARYSKSKFYKLLPSKDGKKELILAKLFTGRTHQIRAHLESINRHIVGDELYGYKRGRGEGERVMLHAYLLELTHPKGTKFAESSAGNLSLGLHSADFANLGRFADLYSVSHPKFAKNHESQTENPSVVDSALAQNLNKNNPRVSANLESRPLRGAKNRNQASSSASADFLLEAEKRGSPPKSEKAAAFWRVGGAGRGVQPFLREKTRELNKQKNDNSAESSVDSTILSQNGLQETSHSLVLPRSYTLARNDDSAKLRFIAPLFDDMKDYLAKNFDMEKVYEILHGLPTRAF